jgi:hypothetical protein
VSPPDWVDILMLSTLALVFYLVLGVDGDDGGAL